MVSINSSAEVSLTIDHSFISAGGYSVTNLINVETTSHVIISSSTLAGTHTAQNGVTWGNFPTSGISYFL